MRVRRCAVLWLESRETASFELEAVLAGGTGVVSRMHWFAHAPQLDVPVAVDTDDIDLLGGLSPSDWIDATPLRERYGTGRVRVLLRAGLLISRGKAWCAQREADERLRRQYWHGLAAQFHAGSRWRDVDANQEVVGQGLDTAEGLRAQHGAPPPEIVTRSGYADRVILPLPAASPLDELLDQRSTCRNFDTAIMLPQSQLAAMLARVFGIRGRVHAADDFDVLKKTSPSGGALHPTEAYLIVQRVEGIAPGLYHYHAGDHTLEPLPFPPSPAKAREEEDRLQTSGLRADERPKAVPEGRAGRGGVAWSADEIRDFARLAVAGQHWFADAPVLVVLSPRFARNFWKYRNHSKAYRAVILDIGHLSQTLYLSATELGLGAFITAAINEVDIEQAFGLTGYVDGPLAVCGFGVRADTMVTSEFDPNRKVWPRRG